MATTRPAELNNGIWTSWLPVTTAWTSQAACNSAAWARFGINPSDEGWPYIYDPAYYSSVANSLTCLPPEATRWWDGASTVSNTITRWSIGPIVCPAAYTTASTIVVSGTSTSIICCPTNFDFTRNFAQNGGIDGVCTSPMTSGQSLTYASPATNSFTVATTAFTGPAVLIAVPVEGYNFAASTTSSSTSSLSSSSSFSSSSTIVSAPQNTADSGQLPTNTSTETGGLTGGAKAGIGIGAAAVVLLVLAGAALLFYRRRRRYALDPTTKLELPGSDNEKKASPVESYSELEPRGVQRAEVDGNSRQVELEG